MVQEAWVRLARYEREKAVLEPEAFLMRTALNLSVDTHRARVSHGEEVLLDETDLIDGAPSADAVLLGRERMARLSLCLGRLNDKRRNIFLAQRVEGMTYREIAHHYQMSISSVEKHIAKALLQVTSWMEGW
jgi:RNA polymerase sigma-70 factor (ECF subfamily)